MFKNLILIFLYEIIAKTSEELLKSGGADNLISYITLVAVQAKSYQENRTGLGYKSS